MDFIYHPRAIQFETLDRLGREHDAQLLAEVRAATGGACTLRRA